MLPVHSRVTNRGQFVQNLFMHLSVCLIVVFVWFYSDNLKRLKYILRLHIIYGEILGNYTQFTRKLKFFYSNKWHAYHFKDWCVLFCLSNIDMCKALLQDLQETRVRSFPNANKKVYINPYINAWAAKRPMAFIGKYLPQFSYASLQANACECTYKNVQTCFEHEVNALANIWRFPYWCSFVRYQTGLIWIGKWVLSGVCVL